MVRPRMVCDAPALKAALVLELALLGDLESPNATAHVKASGQFDVALRNLLPDVYAIQGRASHLMPSALLTASRALSITRA